MKEGTLTVLFGVHSIVHSYYVWKAWKHLYKKAPTIKETICILVHDWGYWGTDYYTARSNDGHAELGAAIAHFLCDNQQSRGAYKYLVLGHSSAACKKFDIKKSRLEKPDEYSWLLAPMWWIKWTAKIEKYVIPPEDWVENVRRNFYLPEEERKSGTEMLCEYRDKFKI